jgi:FKBP-type peptidyl-prolyl cis-trans isomerase
MCVGEKRTLAIPSDMAYGLRSLLFVRSLVLMLLSGQRGFGSVIPANSALVFDVELVSLTSKGHEEL